MKLKEIKKLQEKKLRKFITLVYHFHPYYRRLFKTLNLRPEDIRTLDDLRKLPFTNKSDWVGNEQNFILQPNKRIYKFLSWKDKILFLVNRNKAMERMNYEFLPATFFVTSGRTGNSAPCFYTRHDFEIIKNATIKALQPMIRSLKNKLRLQIMFPYAPHLAFWHTVFGWLGESDVFAAVLGAGRTNTQIELMEKLKTNVLAGMPSYINYFSQIAKENGAFSSVRYIIVGGEYLTDAMKKRIKNNFSSIGPEPRIIQTYASTESKAALFELSENDGYVIDPKLHLWEVVDPKTGENVGFDEKGVIVFTHLSFTGTVFLRYWTDDIVTKGLTYENGFLKLKGHIHRRTDTKMIVTKVKGTLIDMPSLENLIAGLKEIKEYQIIISKKNPNDKFSLDELIIKLSLKKRYERVKEKIVKKVEELVKDYYEITPKVKVKPFNELVEEVFQKLKGMHVVDMRPKF